MLCQFIAQTMRADAICPRYPEPTMLFAPGVEIVCCLKLTKLQLKINFQKVQDPNLINANGIIHPADAKHWC